MGQFSLFEPSCFRIMHRSGFRYNMPWLSKTQLNDWPMSFAISSWNQVVASLSNIGCPTLKEISKIILKRSRIERFIHLWAWMKTRWNASPWRTCYAKSIKRQMRDPNEKNFNMEARRNTPGLWTEEAGHLIFLVVPAEADSTYTISIEEAGKTLHRVPSCPICRVRSGTGN